MSIFGSFNRASTGAAFLDVRQPGWASKIDVERLDISSGRHCVLGQLHRTYSQGMDEYGLGDREARKLGFMPTPFTRMNSVLLRRAWRREIRRRLHVEALAA